MHTFRDQSLALLPSCYMLMQFRDGSRIFQRGVTFVKGGGGGDYSLSDQQNM